MSDDAELLRRYTADQSEAAFTQLIQRHVDLVYSAALRLMNGDVHRAQDVTQQVFTELARQAKRLAKHPALIGWLYTTTRQMALRMIRTEQRRHAREQEATAMNELLHETTAEPDWNHLHPVLEDAMHELGEKDRLAVLLRFFKNKSLKEVGAALGLSDNAARMRVERALEKLRRQLARRGVSSTAAVLASTLAGKTVVAAPIGLIATLGHASLTGAAASSGTTLTFLKIMTATKFGITSGIVTIGLVTTLMVQHHSLVNSREHNAMLEQQQTQQGIELENLRKENERLLETHMGGTPPADNSELLRLRGEVTRLQEEKRIAAGINNDVLNNTADSSQVLERPLANRGRATFDQSLETFLWAVQIQDPEEMRRSVASDSSESLPNDIVQEFLQTIGPKDIVGIFHGHDVIDMRKGEIQTKVLLESPTRGRITQPCTFRYMDGEWKIVLFGLRDDYGNLSGISFERQP